MTPELEELARLIADDVEKRLDAVIVKRLGETATLESIDRRLERLEQRLGTTLAGHASMQRDHERRIAILKKTIRLI